MPDFLLVQSPLKYRQNSIAAMFLQVDLLESGIDAWQKLTKAVREEPIVKAMECNIAEAHDTASPALPPFATAASVVLVPL